METYNFKGISQEFDVEEDTGVSIERFVDQWFFIYGGYSYIEKQAYFFLRFADGTEW